RGGLGWPFRWSSSARAVPPWSWVAVESPPGLAGEIKERRPPVASGDEGAAAHSRLRLRRAPPRGRPKRLRRRTEDRTPAEAPPGRWASRTPAVAGRGECL